MQKYSRLTANYRSPRLPTTSSSASSSCSSPSSSAACSLPSRDPNSLDRIEQRQQRRPSQTHFLSTTKERVVARYACDVCQTIFDDYKEAERHEKKCRRRHDHLEQQQKLGSRRPQKDLHEDPDDGGDANIKSSLHVKTDDIPRQIQLLASPSRNNDFENKDNSTNVRGAKKTTRHERRSRSSTFDHDDGNNSPPPVVISTTPSSHHSDYHAPKEKWLCEVCQKVQFDNYVDAFKHELACRKQHFLDQQKQQQQQDDNDDTDDISIGTATSYQGPGDDDDDDDDRVDRPLFTVADRDWRRQRIKQKVMEKSQWLCGSDTTTTATATVTTPTMIDSNHDETKHDFVRNMVLQQQQRHIPNTRWLCAVCRRQSFDNYFDAYQHEKECTQVHQQLWSLRQQEQQQQLLNQHNQYQNPLLEVGDTEVRQGQGENAFRHHLELYDEW